MPDIQPAASQPAAHETNGKSKGGNTNWKLLMLLQLCVLAFACSGVLEKLAAQHPMLSPAWIGLYFGALCIIGGYALAWQQFLKRISLTTAYANRSLSMLWSMIFGAIVFRETVTWNMILGVLVIAFGVYLVVTGDEE